MEAPIGMAPEEDSDSFRMRATFVLLATNLPPGSRLPSLSLPAAELLSHMFVKKVRYGVSYDENTEGILAYVRQLVGL